MRSNIEKLKKEATEIFQISNILNGKFDIDKSKFIVSQDDIDLAQEKLLAFVGKIEMQIEKEETI
tara:strand:- start:3600 stop:3794 length:195 start_codon:yes stop_codon:yes gene_type:complete